MGINTEKVTLSKVAKLAGVSKPTVSAILNPTPGNNTRYSEKTHKKVMKVVKNTKFRPNRTVRNFLTRKHDTFGLIVQDIDFIPQKILSSILHASKEHNFVVILEMILNNTTDLPILVKEDASDGLIIFQEIPTNIRSQIELHNIPVVEVNTNHRKNTYSIVYDELDGMKKGVNYLAKKERKKILFIASQTEHYSLKDRWEGIKSASKKTKMKAPELLLLEPGDPRYGKERKNALISLNNYFKDNTHDIDAIIMDDTLTFHVYKALNKNGYQPGIDISVIGINNNAIADSVFPELTSLTVNSQQVGVVTVEYLRKIISGNVTKIKPEMIKYKLIKRKSA